MSNIGLICLGTGPKLRFCEISTWGLFYFGSEGDMLVAEVDAQKLCLLDELTVGVNGLKTTGYDV